MLWCHQQRSGALILTGTWEWRCCYCHLWERGQHRGSAEAVQLVEKGAGDSTRMVTVMVTVVVIMVMVIMVVMMVTVVVVVVMVMVVVMSGFRYDDSK